MNARLALALIVLNLLALSGIAWFQFARQPAESHASGRPADEAQHFVTPQQLAAASRNGKRVDSFKATAHNGSLVASSDVIGSRPVVVLFIKNGCPCNPEFEVYFQRIVRAYTEEARFVGVIDADVAAAHHYAEENRVPYLLLADPERSILRDFGAVAGCSVALVRPDGTLHTLWPGYSAEMMTELGRSVAALSAVPERPLVVDDLPGALRAGCRFAP